MGCRLGCERGKNDDGPADAFSAELAAFRRRGDPVPPGRKRLERAGWLDAEWQQTRNGRRARIYSLTRAGRKQLEVETADWSRRASAIARLLKAEA